MKMMGSASQEKTATKSNMADRQRLVRGFGEVFSRMIGATEQKHPGKPGRSGGSHGVACTAQRIPD
ncbi:hypothetical protein DVB73_20005 [Pseudomonas plecoglossicida]|uniref:Uncharacterized protein n=1 Tax=Pseudomonas plecoglossicida TaxID=70775 RepID=A0AAD0QY87_PSEDL|nr:hypothetical protein DVB73_20005 [Pseudomonas plecoglossicida]